MSGSTVYIGGEFSTVTWFLRSRAASVDAATGTVTSFNPNVDGTGKPTVRSFALNANTLYMAGTFGTVGGVSGTGVAAVNPTTGALQSWNANLNGSVNAMGIIFPVGLEPPTLVLGGQFTQAGGQARSNLAAIDGGTGAATTWNPSPNAAVHSLLVLPSGSGGINRVYAGGAFSAIGGQPRNRLAWVDAAGLASSWAPNPNGTVHGLAQAGTEMIAVGAFTTIGGQPRNRIAAVDLTTSLATNWNPAATGGSPGSVNVVRRYDGYSFIGGTHTGVGGTRRGYFAAIGAVSETAVEVEDTSEPASWALRVAPNPFRFATTVRFSLAIEGKTRVTVYDVAGRMVRELHEGWLSSGSHQMPWDGRDDGGHVTASGIYFVRVQGETESLRSKVYRQ